MTTAITVREMPAMRLLVKKTTCGHNEIGPAFGKAIHSVGECLRAGAAQMASAPVAVYLSWRESDCDMAVGCAVEGNATPAGGCEWFDLPAGPNAVASHFGPYDMLSDTHAAIRSWCEAEGRKMTGPCWETYPIDPGTEPDSAKWQTDIHYPIEP